MQCYTGSLLVYCNLQGMRFGLRFVLPRKGESGKEFVKAWKRKKLLGVKKGGCGSGITCIRMWKILVAHPGERFYNFGLLYNFVISFLLLFLFHAYGNQNMGLLHSLDLWFGPMCIHRFLGKPLHVPRLRDKENESIFSSKEKCHESLHTAKGEKKVHNVMIHEFTYIAKGKESSGVKWIADLEIPDLKLMLMSN